MSNPNQDPNFRYPNDNREASPSQYDYPSQQKNDPKNPTNTKYTKNTT